MNCRVRWFPFSFACLLLLSITAALAQNPAAPQPAPAEPSASAKPPVSTPVVKDRRITLEVQVTDKSGAPIRGLQEQDFTVLDDKQPQKILSFHAVDGAAPAASEPPAEIVLVIDAVNTTPDAVANERSEIKKFLLRNGGKLPQPMSLIIFSDSGTRVQNVSTRDGNALAALLDQYETGLRNNRRGQGFYGALERFNVSVKALNSLVEYEKNRPGRKLMIWFSPGWPSLSGTQTDFSRKDYQQFFDLIVSASTRLRQARVTLYSIDPLGASNAGGTRISYYKDFLKGVTSPSKSMPGNLELQVLAVQSGGNVFNSSNDLAAALASCAADADAYYVLSFDSLPADQPDEYHALQVTVDKPGVTARTRTGYYDQR